MTKSGRRALFLLVATTVNFLATVLMIAALLVAWHFLAKALGIPDGSPIPFFVAFLAAVVLSGFAYHKYLKRLQRRPDLAERYGLLK
jgi:membrane protein implicated in regulation of membrane protease activity